MLLAQPIARSQIQVLCPRLGVEVFALWCGDLNENGIQIERSWYKGRYEAPKTPKSQRTVGVPDEILERLKSWISCLPGNGPKDCVFPSTALVTPIWASM